LTTKALKFKKVLPIIESVRDKFLRF